MKMRQIKTALALLAVLALLVACAAPPQGVVQVEVLNAGDFGGEPMPPAGAIERAGLLCATESGNCVESWNGSDIVVYSDTGTTQKFLVDGATGDTTIAGGLTVTGGVTGTNVLTTGAQTVAGVKTFTSAVTGTGGAAITGAAVNLNVASNFATNINTGNSNGAITLGGNSGTVAVNSSDWDITTTGAMTGIGAITADGVVAANAGITVDTTAFTVADTSGNVATAGTLAVGTSATVGTAATVGTDLTLTPAAANGNGALKSELSGLPRVKFAGVGAGTNAALSVVYLDDSPTGECAPVGAAVSEAEGSVAGFFRFGASSYASTFTDAAVEDDGFLCTIGSTDFQTVENFGLWLYPTVTIASGDLQFVTTDAPTGPVKFSLGAMTANTWNWVEVTITALNAGTGDAVTGIGVTLTAQGAAAAGTTGGAWTLYTDRGVKWLSADSDTLAVDVLQDGVLSVANTTAGITLAEWTDYFVRYISGNDAIVYMTNQSAALSVVALVAY